MTQALRRGDLVVTRDQYAAIILDVGGLRTIIGVGDGLTQTVETLDLTPLPFNIFGAGSTANFAEWLDPNHRSTRERLPRHGPFGDGG